MNRYEIPSRPCSSRSRLRIWARTDTSSELTASSQATSVGSVESARAIATRCRWPPESAVGGGQRLLEADEPSSCAPARRRGCRRRAAPAARDDRVDRHRRVERVARILEHQLDAAAALPRDAGGRLIERAALEAEPPPLRSASPSSRRATVVLPDPDSPTRPRDSPGQTANETSSTARRRAAEAERPRTRYLFARSAISTSPRRPRRARPGACAAGLHRRGAALASWAKWHAAGGPASGSNAGRSLAELAPAAQLAARLEAAAGGSPRRAGACPGWWRARRGGRRRAARRPSAPACTGAGRGELGSAGPCSTAAPAYITSTSCAKPAMTPRSWVINSTARRRSSQRRRSSSMTAACVVTSSAVVGSSAISSSGSRPAPWRSSRAGACRPRTRGDTGAPAGGARDADLAQQLHRPLAGLRPRTACAARSPRPAGGRSPSPGSASPARPGRSSDTRPPRTSRRSSSARRQVDVAAAHAAVADAPGLVEQAERGHRQRALARARLPHEPMRWPGHRSARPSTARTTPRWRKSTTRSSIGGRATGARDAARRRRLRARPAGTPPALARRPAPGRAARPENACSMPPASST